jgi:protein involved in polysaccharide export with SLBB domain
MKRILISVLLSISLAGCVSKPVATAEIKTVAQDPRLAVGDCLVLESEEGCLRPEPWRRTIDAGGYFHAPLGQRVEVVGKTIAEARELIASHYTERNMLERKPRLVLMRCEEYDRKRLEIEQRVERAWKGK